MLQIDEIKFFQITDYGHHEAKFVLVAKILSLFALMLQATQSYLKNIFIPNASDKLHELLNMIIESVEVCILKKIFDRDDVPSMVSCGSE